MDDENKVDPTLKDNKQDDANLDDQDNDNKDQDLDDENDNTDGGDETVESLKAKLEKTRQAYENQKIRAKKAEDKLSDKDNKKVDIKKVAKADDLSPKELYSLMENKVAKEDIDDVVQYAKFSKMSIDEALDSDFVKRLLADKAEKRTTARATNIGFNRRGTGKPSEQSLLEKASQKGELPDSDEDIDRLISARLEQKRQKASHNKK